MAKTSISSLTPYATGADLINSYDVRKIAELASDTGKPLTPGDIQNIADNPGDNKIIVAALLRGSGDVEAAVLRGGRYSSLDLQALTGASQGTLKGLVCDLAFYHLRKRRYPDAEDFTGYKEAKEMLESLRDGQEIFSFQETADAGNMSSFSIRVDSHGRPNTLTARANRFFMSDCRWAGREE